MTNSILDNVWLCIGSGNSLNDGDIEFARSKNVNIAVCNDNYRKASDCQIVLAFDYKWWEKYHHDVKAKTNAEMWTGATLAAKHFGLHKLTVLPGYGWSTKYGEVHHVGQSGGLLLQCVSWKKPSLILMLGYDMQETDGKKHWFGDHPASFGHQKDWKLDLPKFDELAKQAPCPVINCSRETALTCFPRNKIENIL